MAQFSIEIADADVDRVLTAIAKNYNRPEQVSNPDFDPGRPENPGNNPRDVDNPETTYQFANRIVREFLEANCQAYEIKEAKRAAEDQVRGGSKPVIRDPQRP